MSVDDSVQKAYDLWEEAFTRNETDIDQYLFALWNTDLGNERGKAAYRKICRENIADAEKAIELEPDVIKHYIECGETYCQLWYYESGPIQEAVYKKKAGEIAETIRKMDPDDTRHGKGDRADAYYFFARIEPDKEKAREYTDKARALRGLDFLAESEAKQKEREKKEREESTKQPPPKGSGFLSG